MNEILKLLWQINYKRDAKESVRIVIRHVTPDLDIAGEIEWWGNELSFGTKNECKHLLSTRFEKGIYT